MEVSDTVTTLQESEPDRRSEQVDNTRKESSLAKKSLEQIKKTMRKHPIMTISSLFVVGMGVGWVIKRH
jgi:hypothetical protein